MGRRGAHRCYWLVCQESLTHPLAAASALMMPCSSSSTPSPERRGPAADRATEGYTGLRQKISSPGSRCPALRDNMGMGVAVTASVCISGLNTIPSPLPLDAAVAYCRLEVCAANLTYQRCKTRGEVKAHIF